MGEGLGRLLNVDPGWVEANVRGWFGDENGTDTNQQIALTTAMAVHHYHPKLYKLFTPSMIGVIKAGEPVVAGWRSGSNPLQRIGEWSIDAVIRGHISQEDPVATSFFSRAPAKVRGEAIGHVAWTFLHAEEVDDAIRDRFESLWDDRVEHVTSHADDHEELSKFYWFVKSHKFSTEWWLPRLKKALELDPHLTSDRYMIGKEIATAADVSPRGAFDVLKLLLQGQSDAGIALFYLTRHAVPFVLARAIASDDQKLRTDAETYMNDLGEQGALQLDAEVRAVLQGSITEDDVED